MALVIDELAVVGFGREASTALGAAIARAQAHGPLSPVTVVVPSNLAGLAARQVLGAGIVGRGGIANVSFLTAFRLAELLSADLLLDTRPLTNPVLGSAVRLALAEDPGPFAAVADHLATESALAALYAELSNVDPTLLARLEAEGGASAATAVRFHRLIHAHLGGFHGEADVARAAGTRPDLETALAPFGHLIWYLPEPATTPIARFIGSVVATAPTTVIVGTTGDALADAATWATCRLAGLTPPTEPVGVGPATAGHIVSATDADEEVRAVVRAIVTLAEQGVPLDRIGVFHPAPDPYVGILEQQLAAAGVPANGASRRRLAHSVAGRTLLDALHLPSQRWRRDRVMALVAAGPLRRGDDPVRPSAWENLSRSAGIVHDLGDWQRKLQTHHAVLEARLARTVGDEQSGGRGVQIEAELADVDQLAAFVEELATAVTAVERAQGWPAKTTAATELLHQLLGPGHLHTSWPEAEQVAFERVEDALVRLAALDELEPDPTHAVFLRALNAELDLTRGRTGRFGHGVLYGPLASAAGQDLDAVFLLGCAEGLSPSARREDAMLSDAARALADGQLDPRASRLHHQHRTFLAALASAPLAARTLTFARGDLRGNRQALPSRWLLDSATSLAGTPVHATDFHDLSGPVVEVVPSFATGLATATVQASLDDRDLAELGRQPLDAATLAVHPVARPVRRGLQAQSARRSAAFTEWDGNLDGQPIPSTDDRPLSASRLETWAACGYRYYLSYVLDLSERDDPERVVDLNPLDRGSGVHEVLERFFGEAVVHGAPDPDQPWTPAQHDRLHQIGQEVFDGLEARGRTGRPVHWKLLRADLLDMLDDFLAKDDAFRSGNRARPEQVELPFGLDGNAPVVLTLPDGRDMAFRGRADRVDRTDDGRLLVSDYKTGKGRGYSGIAEGDPVQGGTTLQLGLYAEAAAQLLGAESTEASYWMVNTAAGYARHGYPWTAERRERFLEVLATIAEGIEGGIFPLVPGEWNTYRRTHDNCAYCEFDSVCPQERGDMAQAKVAAPQLRRRDTLVQEPAP